MYKIFSVVIGILFLVYIPSIHGQNIGFEFTVDLQQITETLKNAHDQDDFEDTKVVIQLPNHVGETIEFEAIKSSVLSKEMEVEFPDFMTYSLQGVSHTLAYGRIFVSRFGVEGVLIIGNYRVKIEPKDKTNPSLHRAYLFEANESFECLSNDEPVEIKGQFTGLRNPNGATRRTYEIAIVGTGEFYQSANFGNNNMTTANAAVVNIINMINVYWNVEMSILLTLYSTPVIYTNPSTDPFSGNASATEASAALHTNYPTGLYDLGHALHATVGGGSGVAGVGVVCNNSISGSGRVKGWGFSGGSSQSVLAINIMTHEVGHMFNSPHTFNGSQSNCNAAQHSLTNAYEIASGTTIMSYAGICGAHDIQSTQDLYFHSKSLELFYNYVNSANGNCSTNISTGNTPPVANASICAGTFTIPILTPFELTGSGSDPDNDNLLYVWEQIDEDGSTVRPTHGFLGSTAGNSNIAPLFRSYPPSTSGFKRTFPSMSLVVANSYSSNFEPLPNVARSLNFRLTARDVRSPYAAYHYSNRAVTVDGTKGPLTVTAPNTAVTIAAGNNYTVTWTVNSTNSLCNSMNILLSTDGGLTYPFTLLSNTPNDGTQSVLFPGNLPPGTQARIRVESGCMTCLKFFDISNVNFTITSSCSIVQSNLCNIAQLTTQEGNNQLMLTLNTAYGNPFTSQSMVPSGSAVLSSLHSGGSPGTGGCTSLNYNDRAAIVRFKPSASGNYSFNMTGGYRHMTVYQGEYNSSQPCTNFLGSTAYGGGNISNPITLALNECDIYTAVFFDVSGTNGSLNITSPSGAVTYLHNPPSNPNYSYTFAAVNSNTNLIDAISPSSNFTSLPAGSYCVYGLYYYSGAGSPPVYYNPSTFVGQTLAGILNTGACALSSSNCKPVVVTEVCSTVVSSSANDGPGTLRRNVSCNTEGSTLTFSPGVNQINLSAGLIITKNMTLQGISSVQRPEINTSSTGITINPGKTLTLQNIDIKHTGSQTIHGGGTLNINGYTISKQ
ncbi:MAG: reprolysin-like metallopeptidase [Saprospiraceae bacterium]